LAELEAKLAYEFLKLLLDKVVIDEFEDAEALADSNDTIDVF